MTGRVMGVDPGIVGTGVACLTGKGRLVSHDMFRGAGCGDWFATLRVMTARFEQFVLGCRPNRVVIEFPAMWSGSATSMASTASGDLFKLSALCGALGDCAVRTINCRVDFIAPTEWKGQLPKRIVADAIERAIGGRFRDHETDAVGIALWAIGRF